MAADVNARQNKQATIAFTLPISCQICLGKVKSPVLCPNNHVFCAGCMEIWLQKNKQCPACRTAMTSPRKILGGLSHHEENPEKLTNPDLRKARFDLLYKEYENEFERMDSEIQLLKTENQILKQQAKRDGTLQDRPGSYSDPGTRDTNGLLALTKKLQDATKLYEKMKGELSQLKQENTNLKDENLSLNRENQHIRAELAGRSPHRYGRITVSTLETKLAGSEKDVTRLTKALERSDKYIEELESELKSYREGKGGTVSDRGGKYVGSREDKHLPNGELKLKRPMTDSKVLPSVEHRERTEHSRRQLFSEDKGASKTSTGPSSMATYSATSFLPTTFTSISSGSSYSTAISVPLTLTTSSYSSSRPSTSYAAKPMDPLSEHYSYVSNVSGGDLSKSDTFALPEPKKRLFDSTDDLDMSMSPIKSNKRY